MLEQESSVRHEYLEGEIYALAGGSPEHAALAAQAIHLLASSVPRGSRVYSSDLRVRVLPTGLATYPDAAVVCGGIQSSPDDPQAVINPILVVEVTSSSTEPYDRGAKLVHYMTLSSVRAVLLVSHRTRWLTLHSRDESGVWTIREARSGESVAVDSLGLTVAVDEIYHPDFEGST